MEENEWCTEGMKESPFYYTGMSPDEYETERTYWGKHIKEWTQGKYLPLWKQKEIAS